jgi:phage protein D
MGLTRIKANYLVLANDLDVTAAIRDRFLGLRLSDETGFNADTLEITLADHDPLNPIKRPPKGAELQVSLGWDLDPLTPMGTYICDEIELGGWPGYMVIRARAAVNEATPKGKTDLATQKARSWPSGTTLKAMAEKIAKEHGLVAVVGTQLAAIVLPQFDQTEESDISFLLRVAKRYDAMVKPAGGFLVVQKRGTSENGQGQALPLAIIEAEDCTSFSYTESSKESPGTVIAYWHAKKAAKKTQVMVGSGEPVRRLRQFYPTEEAATAAAEAEQARRKRGQVKFACVCQGNPMLGAESPLVLPSGSWREGVAGQWLVTRVEHAVDASGGYVCSLDAELPGKDDAEGDDTE